MSTHYSGPRSGGSAYFRITLLTLLFVIPFPGIEPLLQQSVGLYALNVVRAILICVQGFYALGLIWDLEKKSGWRALPFALCFFALQHAAFGFGGSLLSISDADYYYHNDHGIFPFNEALLPVLLVHLASINLGLLGVWAASPGKGAWPEPGRRMTLDARRSSWTWDEIGPFCLVTLILFSIVMLVQNLPESSVPPLVFYATQGFAPATFSTLILWGLCWETCRKKTRFLGVIVLIMAVEVMRGQRGNFLTMTALFTLGMIFGQGWRRFWQVAWRWTPLMAIVLVCFVKSEDVRGKFARGTPFDGAEAVARIESVTDDNYYDPRYSDAFGRQENAIFRIGSRLCELAAMDVVSRTPDAIPFWGWNSEDWTLLNAEILPSKMSPDAAELAEGQHAGDRFLNDYGWSQVDPSHGNSMPATLIGDTWRRFGWMGVIPVFFVWGWFLTVCTRILAANRTYGIVLVSAGIAATVAVLYTSDWVSLLSTLPRRLLLAIVFASVARYLSVFFQLSDKGTVRLPPGLGQGMILVHRAGLTGEGTRALSD